MVRRMYRASAVRGAGTRRRCRVWRPLTTQAVKTRLRPRPSVRLRATAQVGSSTQQARQTNAMTVTGKITIDPFVLPAAVIVVIVAALHVYFLVLEMFLWRKPLGLRTFRMTQEAADSSAVLAANQGLYNGFLAAGLLWGLFAFGVVSGRAILTFFLVCVIVAGLYGAATVSRRIALIQSLPAAIALALVWLA